MYCIYCGEIAHLEEFKFKGKSFERYICACGMDYMTDEQMKVYYEFYRKNRDEYDKRE